MHVEGQLSLSLHLVLLRCQGRVALGLHTLRQELLHALRGEDLLQGGLTLANETESECTQADLDDRAVEQNLRANVRVSDRVLQM